MQDNVPDGSQKDSLALATAALRRRLLELRESQKQMDTLLPLQSNQPAFSDENVRHCVPWHCDVFEFLTPQVFKLAINTESAACTVALKMEGEKSSSLQAGSKWTAM
jgi:hypothetical protein